MRRFPFGLTLAVAVALAILIALGCWQLRRRVETAENQARIAALTGAPAVPLDTLLARRGGARGLDHIRVSLACRPPAGADPAVLRYSMRDGQVGWRALAMCRISDGGFDSVLVDRGLVTAISGVMAPRPVALAPPATLVGVLRAVGARPLFGDEMPSGAVDFRVVRVIDSATLATTARQAGLAHPLPYYVVVERETPAPAGLAPAAVAEDTPRDNFQYALTWFGLAAALVGVYLARIRSFFRRSPRRA